MEKTALMPDIVREEVQIQLTIPKGAAGEWIVTFTCRRTCLFGDRTDGSPAIDAASSAAALSE